MTRGTATLLGVVASGALIWLAADSFDEGGIFEADETGRYWAMIGLLAAAGLVIALSQLLGGWTKWGWPRISGSVFLIGFLPAFVVGGWVLLYLHPGDNWFADTVRDSSDDLGVESLVQDLGVMFPAIAFGLGLVFGLTFDTSGPRVPSTEPAIAAPPVQDPVVGRPDADADDETVIVEPTPREREPD